MVTLPLKKGQGKVLEGLSIYIYIGLVQNLTATEELDPDLLFFRNTYCQPQSKDTFCYCNHVSNKYFLYD